MKFLEKLINSFSYKKIKILTNQEIRKYLVYRKINPEHIDKVLAEIPPKKRKTVLIRFVEQFGTGHELVEESKKVFRSGETFAGFRELISYCAMQDIRSIRAKFFICLLESYYCNQHNNFYFHKFSVPNTAWLDPDDVSNSDSLYIVKTAHINGVIPIIF